MAVTLPALAAFGVALREDRRRPLGTLTVRQHSDNDL